MLPGNTCCRATHVAGLFCRIHYILQKETYNFCGNVLPVSFAEYTIFCKRDLQFLRQHVATISAVLRRNINNINNIQHINQHTQGHAQVLAHALKVIRHEGYDIWGGYDWYAP